MSEAATEAVFSLCCGAVHSRYTTFAPVDGDVVVVDHCQACGYQSDPLDCHFCEDSKIATALIGGLPACDHRCPNSGWRTLREIVEEIVEAAEA